jgi:hypothetical protein
LQDFPENAMTDENQNKTSRKPLLVFLLTFMSLAILSTILSMIDERDFSIVIGTYFLYGGMGVSTIGFLSINRGSIRGSGFTESKYMKDDNYFKKIRAQEKPFEHVIFAIILAGISIAAIGYFLSRYQPGNM